MRTQSETTCVCGVGYCWPTPRIFSAWSKDTGERKQGLPSVFLPSKKSEVKEHSCFPGFQANTQVTTETKLPFPFKSLNTTCNKSHGPTSLGKELQFSITLKAKAATRTTYRIQSQYITNMSHWKKILASCHHNTPARVHSLRTIWCESILHTIGLICELDRNMELSSQRKILYSSLIYLFASPAFPVTDRFSNYSVFYSKDTISSVQLLSRVWLCHPMDCSMPGFPVHHKLPELAQTHVHWVGDAITCTISSVK